MDVETPNEGTRDRLLVEVILAGGQLASGHTEQVGERRRLVDVLNSPEEIFELEAATVASTPGAKPRAFPKLAIEKRAILAAIPRETKEQARRRVVLATVVGRVATVRAPLTLLVPPLTIEGVAHVAPGVGRLRADPEIFAHFFSMTNATIHFPDGPTLEALPVALVNREAVAAVSLMEREPAAAKPRPPAAWPEDEDDQVPLLRVVRPPRPPMSA